MAFNDLGASQIVSEAEAATGGFPLNSGQSHGSSNLCMTKSAAIAKYNLLASNLTDYTDNQLIPKSVWATGAVVDTTPPTTPYLSSVGDFGNGMVVNWTSLTDDSGIAFYEVWRDINNSFIFAVVAQVGLTSYTDTDIIMGNTYSYKIMAYDNNGNPSAFSNTRSIFY